MNRYACFECKEIFSTNQLLQIHLEPNKHDEVEFCEVCLKRIPPCISRPVHVKSHPTCTVCGTRFITHEKYVLHVFAKHQETVPRNLNLLSKFGGSNCYVCGWGFRESALTEIHIRAVHPIIATIFQRLKK
jgi:uncharacterized CHY-type Zn-finger protein